VSESNIIALIEVLTLEEKIALANHIVPDKNVGALPFVGRERIMRLEMVIASDCSCTECQQLTPILQKMGVRIRTKKRWGYTKNGEYKEATNTP
jgi:hypothetical protein